MVAEPKTMDQMKAEDTPENRQVRKTHKLRSAGAKLGPQVSAPGTYAGEHHEIAAANRAIRWLRSHPDSQPSDAPRHILEKMPLVRRHYQ